MTFSLGGRGWWGRACNRPPAPPPAGSAVSILAAAPICWSGNAAIAAAAFVGAAVVAGAVAGVEAATAA